MYADLLFYYGIDLFDFVTSLEPAPARVFALVERLPEDSMTRALAAGGPQYFGWGSERHLMASLYDALNYQTRMTAHWKDKAPDFKPWPRPGVDRTTEKRKVTVADVFAVFNSIRSPNRK